MKIKNILISSFLLLLVACQGQSTDSQEIIDSVKQRVGEAIDTAQEILPQKSREVQQMTEEEVSKLQAFEYKVVELNPRPSVVELEVQLRLLGRDKWDCFDLDWIADSVVISCKRRPPSWFRFMQKFVL